MAFGQRAMIVASINITAFRVHELLPSSGGKISEKLACLGPELYYGAFRVGPNRIGVPLALFREDWELSCTGDEVLYFKYQTIDDFNSVNYWKTIVVNRHILTEFDRVLACPGK